MATLLFLAAGLFIHIQTISSQEEPSLLIQPAEDNLRAAEQAYILSESAVINAPVTGPSIWTVVRMVVTLALAAAAIYGVVYFIRRSGRKTIANDPFLKVLANVNLGFNRYAHVVSVGSKAWLLGSSDGGVNLIGEIDDKDVLNAMLLEDSRKSAEETSGKFLDFSAVLRRMGMQAESRVPGADDIRRRSERLKGL